MTQKPRIEPVPPQRASLLTKVFYRVAKRKFGEVPEPFAVAAHHPRLMLANVVHEGMLGSASKKLPKNVLRTGGVLDRAHRRMLVVRRLRLDAAAPGRPRRRPPQGDRRLCDFSALFTEDERAAIAYADAMTTDPHTITDEQVEDLKRRFGDDGVIELTYQIGVENMRARMYSALGITEQGFSSGDACRVPWATQLTELPRAQRRTGELVGVGDIPNGANLSVAHRHRSHPRRHRRIAVAAGAPRV